jgi:hypothetical protein
MHKPLRETTFCDKSCAGFMRPVRQWYKILGNVGLSVVSEFKKSVPAQNRIKDVAALSEVSWKMLWNGNECGEN